MKKKLIAMGLCGALSLSMLAGCGGASAGSPAAGSAAAGSGAAEAKGAVYYLNFKPEQDMQWHELAKIYTEETGVPVTVLTAAAGQYETTLKSEMAKTAAPAGTLR